MAVRDKRACTVLAATRSAPPPLLSQLVLAAKTAARFHGRFLEAAEVIDVVVPGEAERVRKPRLWVLDVARTWAQSSRQRSQNSPCGW